VVDPDGTWLDPHHAAALSLRVEPDALLTAVAERLEAGGSAAPTPWLTTWRNAEHAARTTVDAALDGWDQPFEGELPAMSSPRSPKEPRWWWRRACRS